MAKQKCTVAVEFTCVKEIELEYENEEEITELVRRQLSTPGSELYEDNQNSSYTSMCIKYPDNTYTDWYDIQAKGVSNAKYKFIRTEILYCKNTKRI